MLSVGSFVMVQFQNGMPAIWNRKYPDKTDCHTHFQQSGFLPGTILAALFLNLSLEKSAPTIFLFAFLLQDGTVAVRLAVLFQRMEEPYEITPQLYQQMAWYGHRERS